MLEISIPKTDVWLEAEELFDVVDACTLHMEHNLLSISKWEQKCHKAFLGDKEKTEDELVFYAKCMTLDDDIDPRIYLYKKTLILHSMDSYISNPMTATVINRLDVGSENGRRKTDTPTSELIYYWMIQHKIPFECENWHLNRLLTLIEICNVKAEEENRRANNSVKGKRGSGLSQSQIAARNQLNAKRRAAMHSKG